MLSKLTKTNRFATISMLRISRKNCLNFFDDRHDISKTDRSDHKINNLIFSVNRYNHYQTG